MLQGTPGVDDDRLSAAVRDTVGPDRALVADTTGLAEQVFGSHLAANVVLLGAACQMGALPVPPEAVEEAITTQGPAAATNLAAFRWGRWLVADPAAVARRPRRCRRPRAPGAGRHLGPDRAGRRRGRAPRRPARAPRRRCGRSCCGGPPRSSTTRDRGGPSAGSTWSCGPRAVDGPEHDWRLTRAVAEGWFKVLTYKDEYEVARLHLRLDLDEAAREAGMADGYKVQFHLHPPTLRRLGVDRKIALGGRTAGLAFRGLAAMRRVRGTPLDLFGLAHHRREERELAEEYGALVRRTLSDLTSDTYDDAVAIAESVQVVKGYEDIKSDAIARWRADLPAR